MSKNIFITRKIPDVAAKMLEEKGYVVEVNPRDVVLSQKDLIKSLKNKPYDAVITLLTDRIDSKVFEAVPDIKMYANYATGYDNLDVVEAGKRGITIANAPAEMTTEAVAEHTFALMLALSARIVEADEFVRRGKYKGWAPMNFIGMDVLGETLGLIGAGRIGGRVAHYASALGMKVIYYDVSRNEEIEKSGAVYRSSVEEVLKEADIVSLHVPLLPTTRHLMNEARLRMMKPTSFLVNTSRGAVVDEKALEKALKDKVIAGAGLDVFEFEPKISRGLRKLQNVILTPHIASASVATRNQMAEIAALNVIDFLEGRVPRNIVNAK